MQKVLEPNNNFLASLKENFDFISTRPNFYAFPQMPVDQIKHFITQAVQKNKDIIIQVNPSTYDKQLTEVAGQLSLSHRTSHVILTTDDGQTIHLIQPHLIRHIRLA